MCRRPSELGCGLPTQEESGLREGVCLTGEAESYWLADRNDPGSRDRE